MSVSKSVTSAVGGMLVGEGRLDPAAAVTDICPSSPARRATAARSGTCWTCAPARSSTRTTTNLDADVRVYEQIYLWRPARRSSSCPRTCSAYYPTLVNDGPHGGPFRYRSILTDMLGLGGGARRGRAAGRADLRATCGSRWAPSSTPRSPSTATATRWPTAGSAPPSATSPGSAAVARRRPPRGRPVVPAAWIGRHADAGAPDGATAFAEREDPEGSSRPAHYRNKWWVIDRRRARVFAGLGINGQMILVHGEHG